MHLLFYVSNLSNQRNAPLRQPAHDTRSTNQARTSKGQLHHAMESRRKRAIDDARQRENNSTRTCATYLNLSQLTGVAPSPGVYQTRPGATRGTQAGPQAHRTASECILNDALMHLLFYVSNLSNLRNTPPAGARHQEHQPGVDKAEGKRHHAWRAGGSSAPSTRCELGNNSTRTCATST